MYTASTKRRVFAHLIDQTFQFIFYIPLIFKVIMNWFDVSPLILIPWTWIIILFAVNFFYQVLSLYFLDALPGQWLLGLKVVSLYHPELGLSLHQCVIHALGEKLKLFIGNGLYYSGFYNRERRHIINLLAETRVVQNGNSQGFIQPKKILAILLLVLSIATTTHSNAKFIQHIQFNSQYFQVPKSFVDLLIFHD